jgi:peptidoglycan/LPS O-acetylase OafA/YrhL
VTNLESKVSGRKDNNLNIIRLLLALLVILSHSFPVALGAGGESRGEPLFAWTHGMASSGSIAVNSFFFISGFLVTASWLRSKSLLDYFAKRVLRIYPAFIVAMGFSAALIWLCCPGFRGAVVHPLNWIWVLLKDLLFLSSNSINWLGIFSGNPYSMVANASLWTIPMEFGCYLAVMVIGVFSLFKRRLLLLIPAVLYYQFYVMSAFHGRNGLDQAFVCFMVGAIFWLWQDKIPFSKYIAGSCLVILLAASQFEPWFIWAFPIAGGYCLLWLAYGPRLLFSNWAEKTDLSYGTYLYAFPIQQLLAMSMALRHPLYIFVVATPITLGLAWLSWNLVEKRFLAMKNRIGKPFGTSKTAGFEGESSDILQFNKSIKVNSVDRC